MTYEDGTGCSETSAPKIQTLGNNPKERIHGVEYFIYLFIYLRIMRRSVGIVALQGRVHNALEGTRPNWLLSGHLFGGKGNFHKILSHDSWCPVRVSNKTLPNTRTKAHILR
jgi:hypothetical protein